MSHSPDAPYELILRANASWFDLSLKNLWQYRDLLMLLVRRDFVAKYKQTILGPLWFVLQPLLMTLVFTVIFGQVAGLPTDGLPPMLFYLCGQLGWNYFAQTLTTTSGTLATNAGLFSKVYFPRLVVPLSVSVSNLFTLVIQIGTFAVFFLYLRYAVGMRGFGLDWHVVFLPFLVIHTALLSLGLGLVLSALTAKYRDLTHVMPILVQVWMYASPVIYPLSKIPADWRWLARLNPMTPVIESYRLMLLGAGTVTIADIAASVAIMVLFMIAGLLLFTRTEKTFVDIV